jgi:NADP-dependent 3-hydroxy acid dehydrogenase YdfG
MKKMLKNLVVVITGAGSGIGKSLALALAKQEAKLCFVGRNLDKLEQTAQIARLTSPQVAIYPVDITKDESIIHLKNNLLADFGQVDVLVHSAGVISLGNLQVAPVAELDRQYRTNVRAPYLLTQNLLPLLITNQGQIVFVNSNGIFNVKAGHGQYSASKQALKAIADSLRAEVNHLGVRVISIYPGQTASPMQAAIYKTVDQEYRPEYLLQPEDIAQSVISALSLPRTAEVTDINIRPFAKK